MQTRDTCGCCEGIEQETPVQITNRPGLQAVAYRVGNYSKFRDSLLAALSDPRFPALRALTTRDQDDFTIALLDAWAVVSDVFTFYQERIANESYLGTATEQKSVLELARLIGYELRPGVAASVHLAFTVEASSMALGQMQVSGNLRAKDSPLPSIIPVGTKVQSIPGPDELPHTFETVQPLEAWADMNAIRPKQFQKRTNWADDTLVLTLEGISNDLKPNDLLLIIENGVRHFRRIVKVAVDDKENLTAVSFSPNARYKTWQEPDPATFNIGLILNGQPVLDQVVFSKITQAAVRQSKVTSLFKINNWNERFLKDHLSRRIEVNTSNAADGIYVFRKQANAFGYNAPLIYRYYNSAGTAINPPQVSEWNLLDTADKKIYLDNVYEKVEKGSHVVVESPAGNSSGSSYTYYKAEEVTVRPYSGYNISSRSTVITTDRNDNWWGSADTLASMRTLTIHVQSEALKIADSPVVEPVVRGNVLTLAGYYQKLEAKEGHPVILFGEQADVPGTFVTELRFLKEVHLINGETTVVFDADLQYNYVRKTLTINANVAAATHGETVREVLGNGDAGKVFQKFELKQPPLTFVTASSASGTQTTLEIRVNDILWKEVPSLYDRGPHEQVYITRQDDQAKTTVIFGDGKTGARLPSGQENVRAVYRKGIGAEAMVRSDQLTLLLTRPLGVKAVTNPFAAEGAEDRERLSEARKNASLNIYTLGRIVSLQDYEDFARAFAGIAKSLATMTWNGMQQCVYITVAGYKGADVMPGSTLYNNLQSAIRKASIDGVTVEIHTYSKRFFTIEGSVVVHPDYIAENVLANVKEHLRNTFSFDHRALGQGVSISEIITVMQQVTGVEAVDIDFLYRDKEPRMWNNRLRASKPIPGAKLPPTAPNNSTASDNRQASPAELLTLDPESLNISVKS